MKTKMMTILLVVLCNAGIVSAEMLRGKIVDENKIAMAGVSVRVEGSKVGVISGGDGRYAIEVEQKDAVLVFAFIGYEIQREKVGGRKIIDVQLKPNNMKIEELVVAGVASSPSPPPPPPVRCYDMMSEYEDMECEIYAGKECISISYDPAFNESYAKMEENSFRHVKHHPLSTFSIDVDGASYSNVRRFINQGSLPPPASVRTEEMINYFSYDYPQPQGNHPFSIYTELSTCPWNEEHLLLHVGLQGKKLAVDELPPSNIVFLLDVSGSMSDHNKLPLVKSSLALLADNLREEDKVSIVVYAGSSGLVLPATSGMHKHKILEALNSLHAGGSTAGGAGLKLAYKVARENFVKGGNNRIILATDGDFNVGLSSNDAMESLIEKEREGGIAISVLGFGMGNYQDDKMEIIANKGNGNYAYIDNLLEAQKVLVNEFGATFFTIAKDVKFQLEFNPAHVQEYRLIGYENRMLNAQDFADDKKDAGEMGAGHTVTALYEIVPATAAGVSNELLYQTINLSEKAKRSKDLITLKLRYKDPQGSSSKLIEQAVKNIPLQPLQTSTNFRFSAAVAQFAMLLRNSEHKGSTTWKSTAQMAKAARGSDEQGYRAEMIRLIESAASLKSLKEE